MKTISLIALLLPSLALSEVCEPIATLTPQPTATVTITPTPTVFVYNTPVALPRATNTPIGCISINLRPTADRLDVLGFDISGLISKKRIALRERVLNSTWSLAWSLTVHGVSREFIFADYLDAIKLRRVHFANKRKWAKYKKLVREVVNVIKDVPHLTCINE